MRRAERRVVAAALMAMLWGVAIGTADASSQTKSNLKKMMLQRKEASFVLAEFASDNPAAGKLIRAKTLTKLTGASFPKFREASSRPEADFVIEGEVEELDWSAEDPVDALTGWSGALLDTLVKESYLKIAVRYRILDAASGKVLWEEKVKNSLTRKEMTLETGLEELSGMIAGKFFQSAFEKDTPTRR